MRPSAETLAATSYRTTMHIAWTVGTQFGEITAPQNQITICRVTGE